jgi:hypothetical protein
VAVFGWKYFSTHEKPPTQNAAAPAPPASDTNLSSQQANTLPPPGQNSHKSHSQPVTPEDYGKLGTDIASRVNQQVAEQLKQIPNMENMQGMYPCALISKACKDAGFVKNAGKGGNDISNDCVVPLIEGKPQPSDAAKPLPQVNPQIITACKQMNPYYGHAKKRGSSSQPDEDPDSN